MFAYSKLIQSVEYNLQYMIPLVTSKKVSVSACLDANYLERDAIRLNKWPQKLSMNVVIKHVFHYGMDFIWC